MSLPPKKKKKKTGHKRVNRENFWSFGRQKEEHELLILFKVIVFHTLRTNLKIRVRSDKLLVSSKEPTSL